MKTAITSGRFTVFSCWINVWKVMLLRNGHISSEARLFLQIFVEGAVIMFNYFCNINYLARNINIWNWYRNYEDVLAFSSQLPNESAIILNTWTCEDKSFSKCLPYRLPSILKSLYIAKTMGKCLDPLTRRRLHLCNTGCSFVSNDQGTFYFVQNSIGIKKKIKFHSIFFVNVTISNFRRRVLSMYYTHWQHGYQFGRELSSHRSTGPVGKTHSQSQKRSQTACLDRKN